MAFGFGHDFNNDFNEDFSLGLQFDTHDGSGGKFDVAKSNAIQAEAELRRTASKEARRAAVNLAFDGPPNIQQPFPVETGGQSYDALVQALQIAAEQADEDDIEVLLMLI